MDCVNGLVIACSRNALISNRLTPTQTSTAPSQFSKCNLFTINVYLLTYIYTVLLICDEILFRQQQCQTASVLLNEKYRKVFSLME